MRYPEQTFLTRYLDDKGVCREFERWGQKRLSTIIRNSLELVNNDVYRKFLQKDNVVEMVIYKTEPNGSNEQEVYRKNIKEEVNKETGVAWVKKH